MYCICINNTILQDMTVGLNETCSSLTHAEVIARYLYCRLHFPLLERTMSAPLAVPPDLIGQSSLYNHPDPLLRRLRLDDSSGGGVTDLDKAFKDKELLILYAGSEHGSSELLVLQSGQRTAWRAGNVC